MNHPINKQRGNNGYKNKINSHNILEAATFGLPLIFGPNYNKFNEAKDLIALGGAISIANYQELNLAIKHYNIFDSTIYL